MAVEKLTTISNWLGLSGDDKPTDAPAGSKFFEYDTGIVYTSTADGWQESSQYIESIGGAAQIVDVRALDLYEQMLITLKKIEYHLSIGSDTELKDDDV